MAFLDIKNVRIAGMATAVPKNVIHNKEVMQSNNETEIKSFIEQIGISERRNSSVLTEADLQVAVSERMLADLGWEKESVDAIICVSLTPDYPLPINACLVQDRLGLSKECYAQDICMGCSGWVYGLSVLATLLSNGDVKRGLLLVGECKMNWGLDRNALLFGHAGCATALEYEPGNEGFRFNLGTDGSGYDAVIMPKSGMRNMKYDEELIKEFERPERQLSMEAKMKNLDVFSFSVTRVPKTINELCEHYGLDYKKHDYIVLHQANKSINKHIAKKMGVELEKAISSIEHFGNTLSASIPITITTQLKGKIEGKPTSFLCCGFGVGLSWGTVSFTTKNIVISDLVEVDDNQFENLTWV